MLKVTSIFLSVNGECCKAGQGSWTVFVRTFGCSARCSYCDSTYSWDGSEKYEELSPKEVFAEIIKMDLGCNRVTITGGEPLEQNTEELIELILLLHKMGYEISIETNGMQMGALERLNRQLGSTRVWNRLSYIVDFKLPSSGGPWKQNKAKSYSTWVYPQSFKLLGGNDFIKFVISDKNDFGVAMEAVEAIRKVNTVSKIYFSPCGIEKPAQLFEWMKEADCAKMDIGYSMQVHKIIFPGDWRDEEKTST